MTDRQKALEWFKNRRTGVMMSGAKAMYSEAVKALEELEKRGEGKWVYGEDFTADCVDGYRCSQCGFFVPWDYNHKLIDYINDYAYCPNCGAKMEDT